MDPLEAMSPDGIVQTDSGPSFTDVYLYDGTGQFKVGIREEWGGTIVYFGSADDASTNVIDATDPGREVQFALYDPQRIRPARVAVAAALIGAPPRDPRAPRDRRTRSPGSAR